MGTTLLSIMSDSDNTPSVAWLQHASVTDMGQPHRLHLQSHLHRAHHLNAKKISPSRLLKIVWQTSPLVPFIYLTMIFCPNSQTVFPPRSPGSCTRHRKGSITMWSPSCSISHCERRCASRTWSCATMWMIWCDFCHSLNTDPLLQSNDDPIQLLQVFVIHYRTGSISASGLATWKCQVEEALHSID